MYDQKEIEDFANNIKKQAIEDWIHHGDFDQWFWDRVNEYVLSEEDIKNIDNIFQKWVDK